MAESKSSSKADDQAPKTRKPKAAAQAGDDKKTARKSAAKSNGGSTAEKKTGRRSAAKAAPGRLQMSAEERYRMVEVAAYYIAERDRFAGNPVEYWTQAEAQISGMLGE